MKKLKAYTYILLGIALILMCACSEEIFSPTQTDGEKVTISLTYSDASPREITLNTRATDAEEKKLNNLYVYVFNASGHLKGFKQITADSLLNQNTSSSNREPIKDIKTKTGASYIYAVANINTGLYPLPTSDGTVEEGKLPVNLDEAKAQDGGYADFTLDKLKALSFTRNNNSIDISSAFLMSGAIDNGNLINIKSDGTLALASTSTSKDTDIKLSRIVAKIRVNYRAAAGRTFTLDNYSIMNIADFGSLIGKENNNTSAISGDKVNVKNLTGRTRNVTDTYTDASNVTWNYMEFYLPENLQEPKNTINGTVSTAWHQREDDSQSTPKVFTNAPAKGTYLVLNGSYTDTESGNKRTANVTYYIHLGDCTADVNDYNVERNCKYTFNITINNIDQIKVEAEKTGNTQPGAEGVILAFKTTGKTCQLDAHYDYMVMRFYQNEVQKLTQSSGGYIYQIEDFNGKSDVITVKANSVEGNLNGATTDWIKFAIGGTYNDTKNGRGVPCSYPSKNSNNLYTLDGFFMKLVQNANTSSFWTYNDSQRGRYIDATCFVDENYYPSHQWNEYVNAVTKRNFYVADEIQISTDKRSVIAQAVYGFTQYNIQTFYDRDQAGNIVAYGCETENDEEIDGRTHSTKYSSEGSSNWDGRANFWTDVQKKNLYWSSYSSNTDLRYDCLSRNRDLDGNGKITEDEVRWYAPTSSQYAGLWIGEEIVSTEAKLYKKNPAILNTEGNNGRMLYYTSTSGERTFWSEEGMATSNGTDSKGPQTKYVRCVRNLKSYDTNTSSPGYKTTPAKYYTWNSSSRLMTLDKVDADALNTTGETGELNWHTERSTGNKPARKFYVAKENAQKGYWAQKWVSTGPWTGYWQTYWVNSGQPTQKEVVNGTFKCKDYYHSETDKTWRVPNQREYCMMYIVAFGDEGSISMSDLEYTFVRTYFSGAPFRYSWYSNGDLMTMAPKVWTSNYKGYVRCISPVK